MIKRIYKVANLKTIEVYMVEAISPAQALRIVTQGQYEITVPNVMEVIRMQGQGVGITRA
jgi:hypothetical protein